MTTKKSKNLFMDDMEISSRAVALEAWQSVFAELYRQGGFEDWWDGIKGDLQQEIVDECIERIREKIRLGDYPLA